MHVYAEVLKRIQSDYVTEPNIGNVTTGALHGLLESLDADSSYLTPSEYKIYKERPTHGVAQIGVTVSKRFGYATIVSVVPGSPAEREHLADGDVIESIGDSPRASCLWRSFASCSKASPAPPLRSPWFVPANQTRTKLTLTRTVTPVARLSANSSMRTPASSI